MGELSGLGGIYEATCRAMVLGGIRWIDENPFTAPVFLEFTNAYGIIEQANPSAKRLLDAMLTAEVDHDGIKTTADKMATGAMVQSAVNHCMYYLHHGWDDWHAHMCSREKSEQADATH
jgi:hypothetical protein